jgi:hypothetical protein
VQKRVTVDNVRWWGPGPGYPRKRIEGRFAGRETLGWREIAALDLPAADPLWWLLRPEFLSARRLHLLACDFAEAVLHLTDDPRSAEAIRVKRLWVDGQATDEELAAARTAARDAAWAAARAAAREALDASRDAAWAAARTAAWDAAWAARTAARTAARDAAWAVAWAAAREAAWAERDRQLALVIAALEEEEEAQ